MNSYGLGCSYEPAANLTMVVTGASVGMSSDISADTAVKVLSVNACRHRLRAVKAHQASAQGSDPSTSYHKLVSSTRPVTDTHRWWETPPRWNLVVAAQDD